MKKRFLSLSAASLIAANAGVALAKQGNQEALFAKWREMERQGNVNGLLQDLQQTKSGESVDYLGMRIDEDVAEPAYFFVYAQKLWDMTNDFETKYPGNKLLAPNRDTSRVYAGLTLLVLLTDQARCKDNTAGKAEYDGVLNGLQEPIGSWQTIKPVQQKKLLNHVFYSEIKLVNRPPNRLLCASGTQQTDEYISDNEWAEKRKAIMAAFPAYITGQKE